MTYTTSQSSAFTRTDAKYLASKVGADLHQLRRLFGRPPESDIDDYLEELTTLLAGGYLDYVEYGFRQGGNWVYYHRYTAGQLLANTDDRPGGVLPRTVGDAAFYSYLSRSTTWYNLPATERERIRVTIPVKRTSAPLPGTTGGDWVEDRTYGSNGVGVTQKVYRLK